MNLRSKKYIFPILIITLACSAIIGLLVVPNIIKIMKINSDISQERADLERKSSLGLNIKQISEQLNKIQGEASLLDQIYIKPGSELKFLSDFDALSERNGVSASVNPQFPDKSPQKLSKINMEIKISGNFENIFSYIKSIEKSPYYFIVDSLDLQDGAKGTSAVLDGYVYMNP